MFCAFAIQRDAAKADHPYDPSTGTRERIDTWRDWSRWKRGLAPHFYIKLFNFLLFLASLATAGLGAYSSIIGIEEGFARSGAAVSFGCTPAI